MSTRSTVAYGNWGHVFFDLMDDEPTLHIELASGNGLRWFSASPDSLTLSLDHALWGVLQTLAVPQLSLADRSDDELLAMAEADHKQDQKDAEAGGFLADLAKTRLTLDTVDTRFAEYKRRREGCRSFRKRMKRYGEVEA